MVLSGLFAAALAAGGLLPGAAPSASASLVGGGGASVGGATAPSVPEVEQVICSSGCTALKKTTIDGSLQITGRDLSLVTSAIFRGTDGRVRVKVSGGSDESLTVPVPRGARSGPVRVRDDYGNVSEASADSRIVVQPKRVLQQSSRLALMSAETTPRRAYFFGVREPRLDFVVGSRQPRSNLRIDVINGSDEIVQSFFRRGVESNTVQTIRWNGRDTAGRPAPGGSYSFRISGIDGAPAKVSRRLLQNRAAADPLAFELYAYSFPVVGRVSWGDGIGAGRNHQGQDLMADCGTPIRAARGGRVTYRGVLDGAAGNYLVIAGKGSKYDFAYMHLLRPPKLKVGEVVRTGQVIGRVGSTGRSTACHLHFEMWSAPGWYKGGSPISPTRILKRWYRQ